MKHADIDARSLAMHKLAIRHMRQDPKRLDRARDIARRWLREIEPHGRLAVTEWVDILERGIEATEEFALAETQRATQLRQSSPVVCTLRPDERYEFLRQWKNTHEPLAA